MAHQSLFSAKSMVDGRWVAIMDYHRTDRAMLLSAFQTRCFRQGEIHEFLLCPLGTDPTQRIDHVAYLGFGEVLTGGVVEVGDTVYRGDQQLGTVLGFDETHAPNHYNVVIQAPTLHSGHILGLTLGETFLIRRRE